MSDTDPLTPRPPHGETSVLAALEEIRECARHASGCITDDGLVTDERDRRAILDDMMRIRALTQAVGHELAPSSLSDNVITP